MKRIVSEEIRIKNHYNIAFIVNNVITALNTFFFEESKKHILRKIEVTHLVDLHLLVNLKLSVTQGREISHATKDTLMEQLPELANVLIHIEPIHP